jgi:hypothetical protein
VEKISSTTKKWSSSIILLPCYIENHITAWVGKRKHTEVDGYEQKLIEVDSNEQKLTEIDSNEQRLKK